MSKIDLEIIRKDILSVLERHGLSPSEFSIHIALKGEDFDMIANQHPDLTQPEMIFKTTADSSGIQWAIQIIRLREPEDFPPGMIISPPPDD